jgi:WD40 repeat protein
MENHVVSGSDDGNYFVWNKDTEELVAIYHGDDNVVNVLQPHPYLPLLAISGIDPTVKIFGPVSNPLKSGNLVTTKNDIIERNKARAGQEGDGEMLTAEDLVTLLYSRMSPDARGRVQLAFAGQGREGGGDDSDEVQECSLM